MLIPEDHIERSLEQSLDHCIKCNICTAACPVSAVTDRFPGPKFVGPQAQRFRQNGPPSPDASVDYCSGCRVCNIVCPTGVRIAEINARARARMVAQHGLPLRNWLLERSELLGRLGCGLHAPLGNLVLHNRLLRLLLDRLLGIACDAPLPSFSAFSFRGWFKRRRSRSKDRGSRRRQVVYFHGCSTNYYEPQVGIAAVEVLERNGFEVMLAQQSCCGLPMLSNGDFAAARRAHERNIARLLPYAQQGIPIVGTSTSCTLTLKEEAPELLGMHHDGASMLARHTYDIFEFLRLLHQRGELDTTFATIERTLPYHPPCQLRAHRIGLPALDILALVPGLKIIESHADCCGIAGTYGLKREKYAIAMAVGKQLFDTIHGGNSTLALCDSETCRWQIAHATGVQAHHPIELIHWAYSGTDVV